MNRDDDVGSGDNILTFDLPDDALERAAIGLRIDTDGRTGEEIVDAVVARSEWAGRS